MAQPNQTARIETLELLGDLHPLVEQLGSVEGLVTLAGVADSLQLHPVTNRASLRYFLRHYRERILYPVELPAIQRASRHASRNEVRELIALDREMASVPVLRHFASASRRVGASQLQRLRPLRDQRFTQRYLAAVERGEAHGWHTLIYGLTLTVYSLPLRQGLLGYAEQTINGFIQAASRQLNLTATEANATFSEHSASLPAAIDQILTPAAII